jgi:hypothetical protein
MLHLTNGDSAGNSLRQAGLAGDVMEWGDALYEGPVPAGLPAAALRVMRARFIAEAGWGREAEVLAAFTARDAALAVAASSQDEMVLWFGANLHDQLQLLQILDRLVGLDRGAMRLSLICIGAHPAVEPFSGLGQLTPAELAALFPDRQPVTGAQLRLAHAAWEAFRSPDPGALEAVVTTDTSALPFVQGALRRHLEEFPSAEEGLSRTERHVLEGVEAGEQRPGPLFRACAGREERPFLGDASFFARVRALSRGLHPLLTVVGSESGRFQLPTDWTDLAAFQAQELTLTDVGRAVLEEQEDWVRLAGIDCWLGGVHLGGRAARWRWSRHVGRLMQPDN